MKHIFSGSLTSAIILILVVVRVHHVGAQSLVSNLSKDTCSATAGQDEVGCIQETTGSTRFRSCDKPPEDFKEDSADVTANYKIGQGLDAFTKNNLSEILRSTQFPNRTYESHNGFVLTVLKAYNEHHNLVIRPDDVWAAIMTQFSFYLNKHSEELRKKFVNFNGKKELTVVGHGSLRTASYDWFVRQMSSEIDKNLVDPAVKNWVLPDFSTTTENDRVTVGVIFMGSMKKYFSYSFTLLCGIPWITLEGTVADWKGIHGRLEKLKEYNLGEWYNMLEPILKQFVAAKESRIDADFWQKICHYRSGASSAPAISGWITAFAFFDEEGNTSRARKPPREYDSWLTLTVGKIPHGIVEVDVKIDDHGKEYKSTLLGGHMGMQVLEDNKTLQPALGWLIALKQE